jgi:hypothetical protein
MAMDLSKRMHDLYQQMEEIALKSRPVTLVDVNPGIAWGRWLMEPDPDRASLMLDELKAKCPPSPEPIPENWADLEEWQWMREFVDPESGDVIPAREDADIIGPDGKLIPVGPRDVPPTADKRHSLEKSDEDDDGRAEVPVVP